MFASTITIEGHLAADPTVMENVTEFVVITNRRRKLNDQEEWVNVDTSRYPVKCFRGLAAQAGEQLRSGDKVIVAGGIITETWADKDTSQNRYKQVVLADAIGKSIG